MNELLMNPILNRVLIKRCNFDKIHNTKIILLESTKNEINKLIYEVVDIGPKVNIVSVGNKIIVDEYIGSEINIKGIDYRIINDNEILALVED